MSATKDQIAALYIAVFNRAPDWAGLQYWLDVDDFAAMAKGFVAHPVFRAAYGDLSHADFVQAIYENVLNGQADTAGLAFWTQALESGLNRGEFLAQFLDAALTYQGTETDALLRQQALLNKVKVALYYTEVMGQRSNVSAEVDPSSIAVRQDPVYQQSQAVLADVTADPPTVVTALAAIDALAAGGAGGLVAALASYEDALATHAAAVQAEQGAAKAAVAAQLSAQTAASDTKLFDVTAVTGDVVAALDDLAALALNAAAVPSSLHLNAGTLAWVRQSFAADIELTQKQVTLLKQQNRAAVTLQKKIQAYNDFLEEVEASHVALQLAEQVVSLRNQGVSFSGVEAGLNASDLAQYEKDFSFALELSVAAVRGLVRLTVADATIQVNAVASALGGLSQSQANALLKSEFDELIGAHELKAAVLAIYQNYGAHQKAAHAIDSAALAALKAAGYRVSDEAGQAGSWAEVATGVALTFDNDLSRDNVALTRAETLPASIEAAAAHSESAIAHLSQANKDHHAFEKRLAHYEAAAEVLDALTKATGAVKKAAGAVAEALALFDEFNVNLVLADAGVATGQVYHPHTADHAPDLFMYDAALTTLHHFDSPADALYFGDKAVTLVQLDDGFKVATDTLGGDQQVLEIFALQDGNDTVLWVEQSAFAGNSSNPIASNDDLVLLILTGVQASELKFSEGFMELI